MANKGRKDESQSNGKDKGTFRFRYMDSNRQFEVQADNVGGENLLEGFRHVANAIAGRTSSADPSRRLPKNVGASAPAEVLEEKDEETIETDVLPFPETPAEDEPEDGETPEDSDATPKPKRKVKAPRLLNDLNLTTAKVSLADFMSQKAATDMKDKYAVVAVWYKKEFSVTEITIDRIHSAFAHMSQEAELPVNVEKPLMNLTYTKVKKWFDKVDGKAGTYTLNWVGESAVNKMGTTKP
jgi:hypothetical protein